MSQNATGKSSWVAGFDGPPVDNNKNSSFSDDERMKLKMRHIYTCILQGVQNFSPYLKNRPWSIGVGNFSQGLICVFLQISLVSHSFPIMLLPNFCYLAQLEHLLCMLQALVLAARLRVSLAAITAVKLRLGDWRWWQVNNSNIRFHMKI